MRKQKRHGIAKIFDRSKAGPYNTPSITVLAERICGQRHPFEIRCERFKPLLQKKQYLSIVRILKNVYNKSKKNRCKACSKQIPRILEAEQVQLG